MSMCFDRSLTFLLCAMSIADMLSAKTAEGMEESLRSSNKAFFNQMWCLTVIARASILPQWWRLQQTFACDISKIWLKGQVERRSQSNSFLNAGSCHRRHQ